jgi:hypothetical protein
LGHRPTGSGLGDLGDLGEREGDHRGLVECEPLCVQRVELVAQRATERVFVAGLGVDLALRAGLVRAVAVGAQGAEEGRLILARTA